jgi:hypothetical protein
MSTDPSTTPRSKPSSNPSTDPSATPGGDRVEQHGPEMDDTQVEATGELRDELPPVDPED